MAQKLKRYSALTKLFFSSLSQEGPRETFKKLSRFTARRTRRKKGYLLPTEQELIFQRDSVNMGKISLVIVLYNTPQIYLEQLFDSLLLQSYRFFELCVADASDAQHAYVEPYIKSLSDARIRYTRVENAGISANTNAAAKLATGDYLAFCDHDDMLPENAFFELVTAFDETGADYIYTDEALFDKDYKLPTAIHYKPDLSPHYLLSCNYICHLSAVKRSLFIELDGLRSEFDGSQDHDFILRVMDSKAKIHHLPKVLYYWRVHSDSTAGGVEAKPYVEQAAIGAIEKHLERHALKMKVDKGLFPSTYRIIPTAIYDKVSIVIPTSDHAQDLQRCVLSIIEKTTYRNYEIIIVDNNSTQPQTFELYDELKRNSRKIQVVTYEDKFNFSAICNFGASFATGKHILLLNNDVEVITPEWLFDMLTFSTLGDVGAVGAKLLYPDNRIQHAGVVTGLGGYAGHSHKYYARDKGGYMFRLGCVNNFSAVTGACLMVKTRLYNQVGGLDEKFAVAFNDVDFCLRLRKLNYYNVYTPYAELYHHESLSRGSDKKGDKLERFTTEQQLLYERYGEDLKRDPFYNIHLTLDSEDFAIGYY